MNIEIQKSLKQLDNEEKDYNQFVSLQIIINKCLSVNTLVDLRGAMYDIPHICTRYFDMGFGSSHFWVNAKNDDNRLLFVTEKENINN